MRNSYLLALAIACSAAPQNTPAPPPLLLSAAHALPGQAWSMEVDGADPGERIFFGYSPNLGSGPCPPALGGACLDLAQPTILGSAVADATGHASISLTLPSLPPGLVFHTQAAQLGVAPALSPAVSVTVEGDVDGDGFGGATWGGDDCDDSNAAVYPGATLWMDADGDGAGDAALAQTPTTCGLSPGLADNPDDCDDGDAAISPFADDLPSDGIDQDCNGTEPEGWITVSAGAYAGCGLSLSGQLDCWGRPDWVGHPSGTFTDLVVDYGTACAIRDDATLACWGDDTFGQATPPAGTFAEVAVAGSHACALTDTGAVSCWGRSNEGQTNAPAETFVQIALATNQSCGLRSDGSITCWGLDQSGILSPPAGNFVDIGAGNGHVCAIANTGEIQCWGSNSGANEPPPAGNNWVDVDGGERFNCALDATGEIACWGWDAGEGRLSPPAGPFISLEVSPLGGCAMRDNGTAACWGESDFGRTHLGEGRPLGMVSADDSLCWLDASGEAHCTGYFYRVQETPPAGPFRQLTQGSAFTCGIGTDGVLQCWGNDTQSFSLAGMTVRDAAAGNDHMCVLDLGGAIHCAGNDSWGQLNHPTGLGYVDIESQARASCAIRANGGVDCWGDDSAGIVSDVPTGRFDQVAVGDRHVCGLRPNGSVECWGSSRDGRTSPPAGTYTTLTANFRYTCGLRTDNTAACWGFDFLGETNPPSTPMASIVAGDEFACGTDLSGALLCWGDWNREPRAELDLP